MPREWVAELFDPARWMGGWVDGCMVEYDATREENEYKNEGIVVEGSKYHFQLLVSDEELLALVVKDDSWMEA